MLVNSKSNVENGSEETIQEETKENERSCCLTVTRIPPDVFIEEKLKGCFEELFRKYGEISLIYLKSFRRARVIYNSEAEASLAKIELHGHFFGKSQLGVYFTQVPNFPQTQLSLQLPPPVKQFLISPPASPPVNWTPIPEATPVINHELIEAVARLQPNEPFEAHAPSDQHDHPTIKVHWCEDEDETEEKKDHPLRTQPRHLVQTQKPPVINNPN